MSVGKPVLSSSYLWDVAFLSIGMSAWGIGCGDFFTLPPSVFGNWGWVPLVGGLFSVIIISYRRRADTSSARVGIMTLAAVAAFSGAWAARDHAATEVWNLRCALKEHPKYCYFAASNLEAFTVSAKDLLGRQCIGSELPYVLCRYRPSFDASSCAEFSRLCREAESAWRRRASVQAVCEIASARCTDPAARANAYDGPGDYGWPRSWPPPPKIVVDESTLPAWLRTRPDAGARGAD